MHLSSNKTNAPELHTIPRLPVLERMASMAMQHNFPSQENTAIISVQHLLGSTCSLYQALINVLKLPSKHIFVSGKCYSTNKQAFSTLQAMGISVTPDISCFQPGDYSVARSIVVRQMWNDFTRHIEKHKEIENIIVLDEGGLCVREMPEFIPFQYSVAGIEQTTKGLRGDKVNHLSIPLINIASCSVKKFVEPELIADAILNRVKPLVINLKSNTKHRYPPVFGVVGCGPIGKAVIRTLLNMGEIVIYFDEREEASTELRDNLYRTNDLKFLISNTTHIFGCTGEDLTENKNILGLVTTDRTFISCSSEDIEFRSLLKEISNSSLETTQSIPDIVYRKSTGTTIRILRSGFPINFDNSLNSVPINDIQLTRGLLLGACMQATLVSRKLDDNQLLSSSKQCLLDPYVQRFIFKTWLKHQSSQTYPQAFIKQFSDIQWIVENSGGEFYKNSDDIKDTPLRNYFDKQKKRLMPIDKVSPL